MDKFRGAWDAAKYYGGQAGSVAKDVFKNPYNYADIPGTIGRETLGAIAPDIAARKNDMESRNDALIDTTRAQFLKGAVSQAKANALTNGLQANYGSEPYGGNRTDAVWGLGGSKDNAAQPGAIRSVLDPGVLRTLSMRAGKLEGEYDPKTGKIYADTRGSMNNDMTHVLRHEAGHAMMGYSATPDTPEAFLQMYDAYASQNTPIGAQLKALKADTLGGVKAGAYANDPATIADELFAQMHTISPDDLKKYAPDLYKTSGWKQ